MITKGCPGGSGAMREISLGAKIISELLREGLKPPTKPRKGTKPTHSSQKRRIAEKKHRSALKKKRQNQSSIDE